MNKRSGSFCIIAALCGAILFTGFFFFPVFQLKDPLINESLDILSGSGIGNTSRLSVWTLLTSIFNDAEYYDSAARVLGLRSSFACLLLYGMPVVGALGMIINGISGNGIGILISSLLSEVFYILQILSLPDAFSMIYKFSATQYLLIAAAAIGIITGLSEYASGQAVGNRVSSEALEPADMKNVPDEASQGRLVGISGEYNGAIIPLQSGETIAIGRDPSVCNLVLQDKSASRIHCYITYIAEKNGYNVRDVSRNGIYDMQRTPIDKNREIFMSPGSRIRIGISQNEFILK